MTTQRFLDGQTALVTGASRGIGAAIAEALAECGADVAVAARSTSQTPSRVPGTLEDTVARVEAHGRRAISIPTDLANEDEVVAMVHRTREELGSLDILINNAAVAMPGESEISRRHFDLSFAVNTWAPMVATREAAGIMKTQNGGRIVNISSATAVYVVSQLWVYGMSKIALEHLTVTSADSLASHSIAVNCFRVDVGIASEGMLFRTGASAADREPSSTAAEGVMWLLRQPLNYTGHLVSMAALRAREGIMAPKTPHAPGTPFRPIFGGLEHSL